MLLVILLLTGRAGAEPSPDDRALATALFQEGRQLMSAGDTAAACPKLQESHRLDPSGGTILNLALCHEQEGMLARSWSEFHEAIALAHRDQRGDREEVAESHVRALEPRLSKLTIVVPESSRVEGLRIERDGRELGEASWSTPMPVDGGEHIVRATAPGKRPFSMSIVVGNEADARVVEVPAFVAALDLPPPVAIAPSSPDARMLGGAGAKQDRGAGVRRTLGWALGAAGLVQWGFAGYFGVQAFRKHAESNSECPEEHCSELGVELNDASKRAADASTVLALTGLATLSTGVYLLASSPPGSSVHGRSRKPPRLAVGSKGPMLVFQGRF